MVEALRHEDFYVTGTWIEESLGVYVGWVARKDSFSDGMPLRNERGDAILVFSGEDFPEPGTAQRLRERGHKLNGAGCDYLVHLYEEDPRFPAGLNGRFHGLLIDRNSGTATLFNDRYGMHRTYYHESRDAFYFAAEAKAILAVCPELRTIDPQAMGEFVSCGCTLEGRSLFQGVRLLPGGSRWVFCGGSLDRKETYFQPRDWENEGPLEPESFYQELRSVFSRNVPRYFGGAEQMAMSLTGGLDTRMILAWHHAEPGSLPCYTFGSMFRENHDVRVARSVAKACGQSFQAIVTGQEFLKEFRRYAERAVFLTDGCVDVSRAPDLYVNERARQIAPVRMTGNYGGEVLRRVRTFKPVDPPPGLFDRSFLPHVERTRETYLEISRGNPVSFAVFKQMPWNHYGVMALEETQLSMRSPYLDNDVVRAAIRAPEAALASDDVCLRLIADGNRDLLRIATDRGVAGQRGPLLGSASRGLLEFSFKAEYAYDMGMPQWVARIDHAFSALHLERLFLGRHKVFHFRVWYRDALAGYIRETLLDTRSLSRPYIDRKALRAIVQGHLSGSRNYTNAIHKLLTLEMIQRLFVDDPEQSSDVLRGRHVALNAMTGR
ncbi:MAG: asparagine synthase-related protein [Candidatus Acidiferrales bacterium]